MHCGRMYGGRMYGGRMYGGCMYGGHMHDGTFAEKHNSKVYLCRVSVNRIIQASRILYDYQYITR